MWSQSRQVCRLANRLGSLSLTTPALNNQTLVPSCCGAAISTPLRSLSTSSPLAFNPKVSFLTRGGDFTSDKKDRSRTIPVEVSMKYLDSAAFQETYGDRKVCSAE